MQQRGFTLIELSVVLVIVGLMAGGILAGQQMIASTQLRSIAADLTRYENAVSIFRDKYDALPGDMPNATNSWGIAAGSGNDATCKNFVSTGLGTCNGNGDGLIEPTSTSITDYSESTRAWQHLKNAGLVEGTFVGTTNGVHYNDMTTRVVPPSRLRRNGFQFFTLSKADVGWTGSVEGSAKLRVIRVAAPQAASGSYPPRLNNTSLSPFEVYSIDIKLDDNQPGVGRIFAVIAIEKGEVPGTGDDNCYTTNNATTATYNAAKGRYVCMLHYSMQ